VNPGEDLAVRRAWVALPGSGWEEDPATAPVWRLSDYFDVAEQHIRMLHLTGEQLLYGTGASLGAVGLDVEGEAIVVATIADVASSADARGESWSLTVLPGTGQLVPSATPLVGDSYVPWITGRQEGLCASYYGVWRNNLGLVNPSPEPLEVTVRLIPFTPSGLWLGWPPPGGVAPHWDAPCFHGDKETPLCPMPLREQTEAEGAYAVLVTLDVTVPPWGWLQLNKITAEFWRIDPACEDNYPGPAVLSIRPKDPERTYYAYLSLVYSPTNDPRFIPAMPGRLLAWDEVHGGG